MNQEHFGVSAKSKVAHTTPCYQLPSRFVVHRSTEANKLLSLCGKPLVYVTAKSVAETRVVKFCKKCDEKKGAKPMTITELAKSILVHLKRLEEDKDYNRKRVFDREKRKWVEHERGLTPIYMPNAYRSKDKIVVSYISYESGGTTLTKEQAESYLAWLEAGNKGTHRNMERANAQE